jgi:hypothetical protein
MQFAIALSRSKANPAFAFSDTCTPSGTIRIRMGSVIPGVRNDEVSKLVDALNLRTKAPKRRGRKWRHEVLPEFNHVRLDIWGDALRISQLKSSPSIRLDGQVLPDSPGNGLPLSASGKHKLTLGSLDFEFAVIRA